MGYIKMLHRPEELFFHEATDNMVGDTVIFVSRGHLIVKHKIPRQN